MLFWILPRRGIDIAVEVRAGAEGLEEDSVMTLNGGEPVEVEERC